MLKLNENSTEVTEVLMMNGSQGESNSYNLQQLMLTDEQSKKIFTPTGYSSMLIGWGGDFDKIIYLEFTNKNEIRQYSMKENKDELLVDNIISLHR